MIHGQSAVGVWGAVVFGGVVLMAGLQTTAVASERQQAGKLRVYFGTYTRGGASRGIYLSELDLATGKLTDPQLAAEAVNPSFLALHPSGRFLYAVGEISEVGGRKNSGGVTAFAVDPETGALKQLNQQLSQGAGPCHLVVDQQGKNVLLANYGGGSVAVLPIEADGRLKEASGFVQHEGSSVNPRRQSEPHAHSINLDSSGKRAFAADLGLDKILIYRFDAETGSLEPNDPAFAKLNPGDGPRHFAFHPSGRFAYTNGEMTSTVTAFAYDAETGALETLQTLSTLPEEVEGNSTAEVQVHPSGKFLYVSNRGHDSLAIFRIDESTGKLTAAGHQKTGGKTPRNFGIDPTGRYVVAANQATDNVVVFRVDTETGRLTPTGSEIKVPMPVCVKFRAVE
ncbi:MAG: lactonase family protein [Planctomycetaceae bacterium]